MPVKVAINGFGRIGRNVLKRIISDGDCASLFEVVAINDLTDSKTLAHLFKYDSIHGTFNKRITQSKNSFDIGLGQIKIISEINPSKLPWKKNNIDIVIECTGMLTGKNDSLNHIKAGAKKVIISAPSDNPDITVVYGVNHNNIKSSDKIISNASCTTNCLATLIKNIHSDLGIEYGLMTTIHSYTNDQVLTDVYHTDLRRARSATQSMIPTKTGAAAAVGLVLPELNGKLDGFAIRVPTLNVSLVDLCFTPSKKTTIDNINNILKNASEKELKGILGYTSEPLVSIDFNHSALSGIYDETLTREIDGKFYKVCAWYDNEWGFSNRMLDVVKVLAKT